MKWVKINVFYLCIILHIFSLFFWKPVFSKNLFKQILTTPFIYVFISLCVNKSLYIIYNIFNVYFRTGLCWGWRPILRPPGWVDPTDELPLQLPECWSAPGSLDEAAPLSPAGQSSSCHISSSSSYTSAH